MSNAHKSPDARPSFMRRLKISHALAAAVVLPLIMALSLSGILMAERQQVAREMSDIKRLGDPLTLLSALVHELQKERGATAVFLASEGAQFGAELRAQRARTDGQQQVVDAYFDANDMSSAEGEWLSKMADVQAALGQRQALRGRVDQQRITTAEALRYYTETNMQVLELIKFTGQLSHDVAVANAMTAFSYYLMGKDSAGIERAVGASGFALGRFSPERLQKLENLIAAQAFYFEEFSDLVSGAQAQILPEIMGSAPARAVQTMRNHALAGSVSGYSGTDFFEAQTRKIELLKAGENQISADLVTMLSARESKALRERNLLMGAMALILLLIVGFSVWLTRSISRSVKDVVTTAEQLAAGDLDAPFPPLADNEIGRITGALLKFRDSIIEARRQEVLAAEKEKALLAAQAEQEAAALQAEKEREALEVAQERARKEAEELAELEARAAEKAMEAAHRKQQEAIREKEQKAAAEIAEVVCACGEGNFGTNLSTADKEGVFADICDGMNRISSVTKHNLEQVQAALSALKNGNISYRMEGEFKGAFARIQQDVNDAFESLSSVIYQIDSSSESVRASTNEIAETSASLATRTEAAAANLEETASSVEELSKAVHRTSELATSTNSSIAGIESHTKKSTEIVKETIAAITGIKAASQSISKTITVIDEIAFQTNLLALNAGVEAARAGEAGRGFAVVASEIRDLAAKSSDAAHEISTLMKNNEVQVAEGVKLVDQTGEALTQIDVDITAISRSVSEIAEFATQQTSSIDEIKLATNQLDRVTQENAAMFEETTALNMSLKSETEMLRNIMANFQIDPPETNHPEATVVPMRQAPVRALKTSPAMAAPQQDWQDF